VAVGDTLINFRFHLVSLTAIFLALAIGITMGATVVQKKTVDALDARIKSVEQKVTPLEHQVDQLNAQHAADVDHANAAADIAVAGRLPQVNVMMIAPEGIDRAAVDSLRDALLRAAANVEGTLWFTPKLRLDKPADVQALAQQLNVPGPTVDALRALVVARLVSAWAAGPVATTGSAASVSGAAGSATASTLTTSLAAKSWLTWEPPPKNNLTLGNLPLRNTYFVVVSDAGASVPNEQLALPLTTALATSMVDRVVAAEDGRNATDRAPAQRALFVGPLRGNPDLAGKLSTVDNLDDPYGRVATVIALADEAQAVPKVGDFGVGPGIDRFLPEPSQ
jgi:hypothetical protein